MRTKKHIFLLFFLSLPLIARAVDASYYSSLNGNSGSTLRQALTVLLYNKHTMFDKYGDSGTENWDFPFDYDSNGYVWDIYTTNCQMTADIGSGNTCCCDGLNREHVVCQSTFGGDSNKDKIPQYSDRHHLYLVDAHTNSFRNNYAYGECQTSANASHGSCKNSSTHIPDESNSTCENHSLGWLGTVTTYSELYTSSQKVYEVDDQYKGDIARAILYMVVRYAEKAYCRLPDGAKYCSSTSGVGSTVSTNLTTANDYPVTAWVNSSTSDYVGQLFSTSLSTNYGLSDYGKAILLKWHRQDPVSQKEIDRNAGVEAVQGNRNPFVDYPCLVEYLWGDHAAESFNTSTVMGSFESSFVVGSDDGCSCATEPSITTPTGTIDFGATNTSTPITKTITVKGVNLTNTPNTLSLAVSGTDAGLFSISLSSISKANAETGKTITITYTPTSNGTHSATLTISGCGVTNHQVTLTGLCTTAYSVSWVTDGVSYHSAMVNSGETATIPESPDNCSSTRFFMGWTAHTTISGEPDDLFTTTAPAISNDITFYAVYADVSTEGTPGIYTLYSGDLVEGDYIVVYNSKAMKATVSSNRFSYADVTPASNQISTTDESIIWHIAKSGSYWTLYNANAAKFAAGTGAANKGQLLDDANDDKALWTASGSSTYEFINKYNSANSINANLRNNGTYGFACYSSSTGGALSLYKAGSSVSYSNYSLACSSSTPATVTAIFMNGATTHATHTGIAGSSVAVDNPEACDGYTFLGWSTNDYAATNTASPTIHFNGSLPAGNTTYHAVYRHMETISGSGSGAPVGTTLWAEDFGGFNADDIPSSTTPGAPTVYGGGSVTYACSNGSGTGTTKIYTTYLASGGTEAPELLICRTSGCFSISNIPVANADSMILTFKTNKTAPDFSITTTTPGITIVSHSVSSKTATCGIKNNSSSSIFTLIITNTNETSNGRYDDFALVVSKIGDGSSTTTYYTTSPDCDCTYTITAISDDDQKGTAKVE